MTYHIDIVAKITELFSQLRKAEQKIAQTILDDLDFASRASISELSDKANVSEATVTRLAKALGCQNVRDLKMQLAKAVAVGERFLRDVPAKPSGINGVYESIHQSLTLNADLITQDMLDKCLDLFAASNQVLIFGVGGSSTIMATELQYRLFRLGVVATAYSDPLLMRMTASTIRKKDVVVGISMSGGSPDVCEAAEIAGQYGAQVISITRASTPLAKIATVNLPIKVREDDNIFKPTATRYVPSLPSVIAERPASSPQWMSSLPSLPSVIAERPARICGGSSKLWINTGKATPGCPSETRKAIEERNSNR